MKDSNYITKTNYLFMTISTKTKRDLDEHILPSTGVGQVRLYSVEWPSVNGPQKTTPCHVINSETRLKLRDGKVNLNANNLRVVKILIVSISHSPDSTRRRSYRGPWCRRWRGARAAAPSYTAGPCRWPPRWSHPHPYSSIKHRQYYSTNLISFIHSTHYTE